MKFASILGLSLGLSLGFAFAEEEEVYKGLYLATGLTQTETEGGIKISGWYDAEKTEEKDGDDLMCYAASAANILAWWQNGSLAVPSDAPMGYENIWTTFKENNQINSGGSFHCAVNWWLTGVYAPSEYNAGIDGAAGTWSLSAADDPMWERHFLQHSDFGSAPAYPVTLPNYQKDGADFRGYYYDQYGLTQEKLSDFMATIWDYTGPLTPNDPDTDEVPGDMTQGPITLNTVDDSSSIYNIDFAGILEESVISLAIFDDNKLAHAITLWGVEYDEHGKLTTLFLTDSDDYKNQLFSVSVTLNEAENKIYFGNLVDGNYICNVEAYQGLKNVYIGGVYAIDTYEASQWKLVPEPTTTALSLLALAGLAARRRRK